MSLCMLAAVQVVPCILADSGVADAGQGEAATALGVRNQQTESCADGSTHRSLRFCRVRPVRLPEFDADARGLWAVVMEVARADRALF